MAEMYPVRVMLLPFWEINEAGLGPALGTALEPPPPPHAASTVTANIASAARNTPNGEITRKPPGEKEEARHLTTWCRHLPIRSGAFSVVLTGFCHLPD